MRLHFNYKELKEEIIGRMDAGLDVSGEEFSNEDLVNDFENRWKKRKTTQTTGDKNNG